MQFQLLLPVFPLLDDQGIFPRMSLVLLLAAPLQAHHDVRASMALFEKSLNIPALHAPPSPKTAAAAAAAESCSPRTIAAVRAVPAPPAVVLPPQPSAPVLTGPAAESIESLGTQRRDLRQPLQALQAAPAVAAAPADDSRLPTAAAVQHLLSGVRPTATGTLPPPSPLQAAVGGLAELGYGGGGLGSTAAVAARGVDRESIWQQELSQELYRVKASTGVPNRRVSMHGSPSPTKKRLHGSIHP